MTNDGCINFLTGCIRLLYWRLLSERYSLIKRDIFEEAICISFLQDHERIRGGLYFLESIPRDENWKVLKDALKEYKSIKEETEGDEVIYCRAHPTKLLT